jgi:hypothetical protein
VRTWLDAPATLTIRFRGGSEDHAATLGSRSYPLPKGAPTTIRLKVPAGGAQTLLGLDWSTSEGAPRLEGVELGAGAGATPLT